MKQAYKELDNIFTDREAWFLFRWSAFLETFGWTVLLIGILFQVNKWPGDTWLLPIGGSLHGLFVLAYMFIAFFAHRSFASKWTIKRMLFAEAISVIPYGALAFELFLARQRKNRYPVVGRNPLIDLSVYTTTVHGRAIIDYEKMNRDDPALYSTVLKHEHEADRKADAELQRITSKEPTTQDNS